VSLQTSSRARRSVVLTVLAALVVGACGGGGGGGPEEPTCTAGVSETFSGASDWVAAATGVGDGADGRGGVGIQAAISASPLVGARVTVRRADGSAIGTASTGTDGRVTLKACNAAGPFLIEVEGTPSATYFDAAKGAAGSRVPFGEGEVLRAVVPALTSNIGVTPWTEAAAQRLLGRASATASRTLPGVTVIEEAHRQLLETFRRLLPPALGIDSLLLMPGVAEAATLTDRPADRYALSLAALGFNAAQFNATLAAPALAAARQLAADAADGQVDGRDANGVAVAAIGQAAYDAGGLRAALDGALALAARVHATPALRDRLAPVLAMGALALPDGAGGSAPRVVRLGRDGTLVLLNPDGSAGPALATDIAALHSASQAPASALFLKRTDGSVAAVGVGGAAGLLALGANQDRAQPADVAALRGASAFSIGSSHALARMPDGSVLGWGQGTRGQLTGGVALQAQPAVQAGVTQTLAVLALNDLSFALQQDGRVLAWGTGAAALGSGGTDRRLQALPQPVQMQGTTGGTPLTQVQALSGFAGETDATLVALRTDGTVWAWGENTHGGLGTAGAARPVAAQVPGLSGIAALAATDRGFVAIDAGGALFFWGAVPVPGTTGTPTTYSEPFAPRRVDGTPAVRAVQPAFAGLYQARVLTQDNDRWQTDGFSAREISQASELDTSALAAGILSIAAVSGDNLVNAAERSAGVPVGGTVSEAGRPVTVQIGGTSVAAQVSGTNWTALLPTASLPTSGSVTFSARFVTTAGLPSTPTSRTITVDAVAPGVTVTDNVPGATANGAVTFSFAWSEPPVSFGPEAVTVTGGSKGVFSQLSSTSFTMQVVPPANAIGEIVLTLAAGAARDGAGNPSIGPVTARQAFKTDLTPPALSIGESSGGLALGPVTLTFSWSEAVTGFTADDVVVNGATKGALTPLDARTFTMVLTPPNASRGTLTVNVPAGAVRDAADNASVAAASLALDYDTALFQFDYGGAGGGDDGGGEGGSAGDAGTPGQLPAPFTVTATPENGRLRLTWDRHPASNPDPNANVAYYLVLERDSQASSLTKFVNRINVTAATPANARFSVLAGTGSATASYRIRACNGGSGNPALGGGGGVADRNWCRDSAEFRNDGSEYPPERFWPDRTQVDPADRVLSVQIDASGPADPRGVFTGPFTVTFTWNTDVGEFDRNDVSVDRGTVDLFTTTSGDRKRYSIEVTPPPNSMNAVTVTVRRNAVFSAVSGPNEVTQATFKVSTVTPSSMSGRPGELTVLAGFPTISSDFPSRIDGWATYARFRDATHLAIDGGDLRVSDYPTIRHINGGESVVTSPLPAATVGAATPADGPLSTATIRSAGALAQAGSGVLYFADDVGGPRIRRMVTSGASAGVTTLPAGVAQGIGRIDGMAFDAPRNVLYVADSIRHVIWRVTLSPTVTVSVFAGGLNVPGSADGTGTAARFLYPYDVAVDATGNVFVADSGNSVIRRITPAGVVTLYAGIVGERGYLDAPLPTNAVFYSPTALAVDFEGSVYVVEAENHAVRRISPTRAVTTVVGNGSFFELQLGPLPGSVFRPVDVAVVPGSQTLVVLGFGAVDPANSFYGFGGMVFVARPATRWP